MIFTIDEATHDIITFVSMLYISVSAFINRKTNWFYSAVFAVVNVNCSLAVSRSHGHSNLPVNCKYQVENKKCTTA